MSAVKAALDRCAKWTEPRTVDGGPLRLSCRLAEPASADEIAQAWPETSLPPELQEFWLAVRSADLFIDVDHGQWGLRMLSPAASARRSRKERVRRPTDLAADDIVIGEFLGDQDLLVVDREGGVMVALPIDPRRDWYQPAQTLSEFLLRFAKTNGSKFWERPRN